MRLNTVCILEQLHCRNQRGIESCLVINSAQSSVIEKKNETENTQPHPIGIIWRYVAYHLMLGLFFSRLPGISSVCSRRGRCEPEFFRVCVFYDYKFRNGRNYFFCCVSDFCGIFHKLGKDRHQPTPKQRQQRLTLMITQNLFQRTRKCLLLILRMRFS